MVNLAKRIKKISGYRGPTTKTLIPKSRSLASILGIKKQKSKLRGIFVKSKKVLLKQPKKRPIRKKKNLVRRTSKISNKSILRGNRIGDSKKPAPNLPAPLRFGGMLLFEDLTKITSVPTHSTLTSIDQVIWVKLSPRGKQELLSASIFGVMAQRFRMGEITQEMNLLYLSLLGFAEKAVRKHVPKDTGDLRNSLIASMNSALSKIPPRSPIRFSQLELKVGFYSDIPYLKYINNPKRTITVRHHKNMGIISYRGGKHYLHDPKAKTKFMFTTKAAIRYEAKRLTKQMIRSLWNKWKPQYTYNQVKSLFKYPGMGRI